MPRTIGIVVDHAAAFGRRIIIGVTRFEALERWRFILRPSWGFDAMPQWHRWKVDGLILQTYSPQAAELARAMAVPVVNVASTLHGHGLPSVICDNDAVGRAGADHLHERGYRNFAFVGRAAAASSQLRHEAFEQRLRSRHRSSISLDIDSGDLNAFLVSLPRATGIMAYTDEVALQVLEACLDLEISVPDHLGVLGVDNDPLIGYLTTPPLSSINVPAEKIGVQAAAMLEGLMHGNRAPAQPVLVAPAGIVTRQSSDGLALDDRDVAAAVNYIRQRAGDPIQVEDVLQVVPISRRSLERRFRQILGRSPLEEIRRAHVERAQSLLAETDLKLTEVARKSGFASATHLGVVFREVTGLTPSAYRQARRAEA